MARWLFQRSSCQRKCREPVSIGDRILRGWRERQRDVRLNVRISLRGSGRDGVVRWSRWRLLALTESRNQRRAGPGCLPGYVALPCFLLSER